MRPSLCRALALFLIAAALRAPAFAGGPKAKPAAPARSETVITFEEKGFGVTEEDARNDAREKLKADVRVWLEANRPDITCAPSDKTVRDMKPTLGKPQPRTLPQTDVEGFEVELKADLTTAQLSDLEYRTRQQLATQRQGLLARGLGGAVVLLLVMTGYLRLAERMPVRYKRVLGWLTAGVIGLAGLASVLVFVLD
jgi:hypothetical protein